MWTERKVTVFEQHLNTICVLRMNYTGCKSIYVGRKGIESTKFRVWLTQTETDSKFVCLFIESGCLFYISDL